jgi:hypothetical protein
VLIITWRFIKKAEFTSYLDGLESSKGVGGNGLAGGGPLFFCCIFSQGVFPLAITPSRLGLGGPTGSGPQAGSLILGGTGFAGEGSRGGAGRPRRAANLTVRYLGCPGIVPRCQKPPPAWPGAQCAPLCPRRSTGKERGHRERYGG